MTTDGQFPDAEQLVAAWLRADTAVSGAAGDRVYTRIPGEATLPLIRVTRVGGTPTSEVEDAPRIQIECWAAKDAQSTAMDLARDVVAAVPKFRGKQSGKYVVGPYVTGGPVQSQDQPTGQERYWVEISFNTYVEA